MCAWLLETKYTWKRFLLPSCTPGKIFTLHINHTNSNNLIVILDGKPAIDSKEIVELEGQQLTDRVKQLEGEAAKKQLDFLRVI